MSTADRTVSEFQSVFRNIQKEVAKAVIGHEEMIENILIAFFAGGHVLIEGVPGTGKTLIVRSLADVLNLSFNRVQFTVDLMPADITGTRMVMDKEDGRREFVFVEGPVFAHVLLADVTFITPSGWMFGPPAGASKPTTATCLPADQPKTKL